MADPVELILDFLQKHQFSQAEAAFKAELLARKKQECLILSSEDVLNSDPQIPSRLPMESIPNKGAWKVPQNVKAESAQVSEAAIRNPEKQLHTGCEAGGTESLVVISSFPHDYENVRPSTEAGLLVPCEVEGGFASSTGYNANPVKTRSPFQQIELSEGALPIKTLSQENWEPSKQNLTFPNDVFFTKQQSKSFEPTSNQHQMVIQGSVHQNKEQHREFMSSIAGHEGLTAADVKSFERGELVNMYDVKILHNTGQEPEELPRLPPVRIHSIDKNMDMKDAGSGAENEASTRSFESAAIMSVVCESGAGLVDAPLSQDMSSNGLKRLISRPSVSQGIVEDMSEQLSGFASALDGQSERWYPDDYCDSDTWDDDDDPGYHRQPIEDEEWFLSNEIDYPSDVERSKQHTINDGLPYLKHPKEIDDEDERSFVEEDSYLSGGEEYSKLQTAAKDVCNLQQVAYKKQIDDSQSAYSDVFSRNKLDVACNDILGNFHNAAYGPNNQVPQDSWNCFPCKRDEQAQTNEGLSGSKIGSMVIGSRPDDDNNESVKSGSVQPSSDVADIGSDIRDSVVDVSSEADTESFRDQELIVYGHPYDKSNLDEFGSNNAGRHVQVKNAPVQHFDEDDNDHDVMTQFQQGWSKRTNERESAKIPVVSEETMVQPKESARSIWSHKVNMAQVEVTGGFGNRLVRSEDTLDTWKPKSNDPLPIVVSHEENVPNPSVPSHHSAEIYHSSLEAEEDKVQALDVNDQLQGVCQISGQDDDGVLQEEMRTQVADEDQYEIFDLRIIHRKNRTGFEEDKDFPVIMNSVIAGRYHVTEYLGSAAFSKAIQAHDLQTGMDVCMKIIKNNKDFFDQSLDEIKLLKYINKHDPADKYHILRLYDYFYHREHLFIVCELLRANLYEFHKYNRESGGEVYFTMPRLQLITIQCLEALEFLHKLGIIHCDLKPENILVKSYSRCEIKIIDLGSSCFQTDHLCSYVQSRSYRAPEVILGLPYDKKIDIWSLGCILAELCTGNVLFQNDSLATLLARVVGIIGPIDPEVLAKGRDTYKYFTKNYMLYERNQETDQLEYLIPKKTSLSHRLPMGDPGFIEFVSYLLQSNPAKRPTASEALQHPWLSYPYEPISS